MLTSFLESGLFQDAVQGAWGQVIARFARDRDTTWLGGMLELPVAPFGRHEMPAIVLAASAAPR
jgi:hypothetical protein